LQCRSQTRHHQCTPTVDNVADIERSISSLARQDNGGLVLPPDIFTNGYRKLIIGLAAEHRLPAVYAWRYFVTEGGLMSYGIDLVDGIDNQHRTSTPSCGVPSQLI